MLVNARSDVTTRVKWRCLHYFRFPKLGRMQGRQEGPLHSKQDGGCVFPAFVQVVHHFVFMHNFSLFLLLTDKTRTAVKVIYLLIKKDFSAVYIFPCTLNGNIP